jgi:outer membrane protein TolC
MRLPLKSLKFAVSAALLAALALKSGAVPASAVPAVAVLDIAKAEELAEARADEVAARNAAAAAALASIDAARAQLLPKLSGSASGAYLLNPPAAITVKAGSLGDLPLYYPTGIVDVPMPADDLTLFAAAKPVNVKGNLSFSQPLFAWGRIKAAIDIASLESEVASVAAKGAALDAAREAEKAYFSALLSKRSAGVLSELRVLAVQIVADRGSALGEGLSTGEQLLSAKADLADIDSRIVEAKEGEKSSLEALAFLTGLDAHSIELGSDFRDALPPIDEDSLKEGSTASSTAFGEARARLSEARRKLDLERGSGLFRPELSLFASLDASNQDTSNPNASFYWDLSVGLAAKVDLFDGGAAASRVKEAEAEVDAAGAALGAALGSLRLEARRAVDAARRAEASLAAARARGAWAAEALRNARSSAAEQLISRSELGGAEIREASARLAILGARYALEEALADLDRLGTGAPPPAVPEAVR